MTVTLPGLLAGVWSAGPEPARVVSVRDGDTIRVQRGGSLINVRLASIDAPEMAQRPHGAQARRALQRRLPPGSRVRLEEKTTDRLGRLVAEVVTAEGAAAGNVNRVLVGDGLAFTDQRYLNQCDGQAYRDAGSRAPCERLGISELPGGITRPWNFRRNGGIRSAKGNRD